MSAFLLGRKDLTYRVLFGNDTDVTFCCYVRMGRDTIIEHSYWVEMFDENDKFTEKNVTTRILTRKQFTELFELQYGSPMHFINRDDFEKFINQ